MKCSNQYYGDSLWMYYLKNPIYDDQITTDIKETEDNPVWEVDENGEYVLDENGNQIPKIFGYEINSGDSGWVGKKEDFNLLFIFYKYIFLFHSNLIVQ